MLAAARLIALATTHGGGNGMSNEAAWPAVKIFADGADLGSLHQLAADRRIRGFTTNPTLMRKAGVDDYARFAKAALELIVDRPISFEVFSDDVAGMRAQAHEIASWGANVYVKIPVTNTRRESMADLVQICRTRASTSM